MSPPFAVPVQEIVAMPEREVNVTTYAGYKGRERPQSIVIEGKTVEVLEIVRMWIEEGRDDRRRKYYYIIKGSDGSLYTLYYDEIEHVWFLKDT